MPKNISMNCLELMTFSAVSCQLKPNDWLMPRHSSHGWNFFRQGLHIVSFIPVVELAGKKVASSGAEILVSLRAITVIDNYFLPTLGLIVEVSREVMGFGIVHMGGPLAVIPDHVGIILVDEFHGLRQHVVLGVVFHRDLAGGAVFQILERKRILTIQFVMRHLPIHPKPWADVAVLADHRVFHSSMLK
jgi:hypothetical protein